MTRLRLTLLFLTALLIYGNTASANLAGTVFVSTSDGTPVKNGAFGLLADVYIDGLGLPDGFYYFQVTDQSGKTLLSTDTANCRLLVVANGRVSGAAPGAGLCTHVNGTINSSNGTRPVQLNPFSVTPNKSGAYKVWVIPQNQASVSSSDLRVLEFDARNAQTDNFKVRVGEVIQGSCQPASALSVLVSGKNVVAYVAKGSWVTNKTGVAAVNVEGKSITNTLIPTRSVMNSCASDPITGQTVCTANLTDVYLLKGNGLDQDVPVNPLTSGASDFLTFSDGSCMTCNVTMDAEHHRAVLGVGIANTFGGGGFQFLNLGSSPAFEPVFKSQAFRGFPLPNISEAPLIDPIRNLLLSTNEHSNFEIINVKDSRNPESFVVEISPPDNPNPILDSPGEDCSTGIALASMSSLMPSQVFLADLSDVRFSPPPSPDLPGGWGAPFKIQTLSDSFLTSGASGVAVAQGTHIGVLSSETGPSGANQLTAFSLPPVSGGGATPAINDWITCSLVDFIFGFDPHTVTAYKSPDNGHAMAVFSNIDATRLAVVDLTDMLDPTIVARPNASHACGSGALAAPLVRFIDLP
jgi:hypothetical protein